jgi:hypothetical protein
MELCLANADFFVDAWCTAEICTAIVVVCLPSLKVLIVRSDATNSYGRSKNGYGNSGSSKLNSKKAASSRVRIEDQDIDDEIGLVLQNRPGSAHTEETTPTEVKSKREKDNGVVVGTNETITRDMI